jgi:acyl-CoA-dependent ceramide synthase
MIFTTVLEKWRRDFPEMMIHHFMTSGMLYYSYKTNYAIVGVWILFEQDFADIWLPLAKMAKYSKMETVADIMFAVFALAWIPTRHVFFFYIYYSIWTSVEKFPNEVALAGTSSGGFFTLTNINGWLIALGLFQCLLLVWLKALLFAVYKALCSSSSGSGKVEDHRSDSDQDLDLDEKSLWQLLFDNGDDIHRHNNNNKQKIK